MGETICLRLYGVVQNVGLRFSVFKKAKSLNFYGYVKNLSNGAVEICINGNEKNIEIFIDWLNSNPGYSQIDQIKKFRPEKSLLFDDFEILY